MCASEKQLNRGKLILIHILFTSDVIRQRGSEHEAQGIPAARNHRPGD